MKTILLSTIAFATIAQASAGILVCSGAEHTVKIDSTKNTIQVSPEMKIAVAAVIANGPEKGLYAAYDKTETFVIYLGEKDGKMLGNLQSASNEDLEEQMTCTGKL